MWRWIIGGGIAVSLFGFLAAVVSRIAPETIFWKNQRAFMIKAIKTTTSTMGKTVLGAKIFMQKTNNGVRETVRLYGKTGNNGRKL